MKCCMQSWRSAQKAFLSQSIRRLTIVAACAALVVFAQPALAQRGEGNAGGFSGGHAAGSGGHFGGGHSAGGERPFGGTRGAGAADAVHPVGGWAHAEPARGGMASYSGERASGEQPAIRSYGGETGAHPGAYRTGSIEMSTGARGVAAPGRFGGLASERNGPHVFSAANSIESARPRHTTIGFPPGTGAWQLRQSPHRAGVPLGFAGQGRSVWQTSPRSGRDRPAGAEQALRSRPAGEWQPPENRGDRNDRLGRRGHYDHHDSDHDGFPRRFHRRLHSHSGYGFFGYPFYGYGLGFWPACDESLGLDWYWLRGYDENCENGESQDQSIAAYGADQSYGAPQADTQRIYGPYAWQNPPSMSSAKGTSSASAESEESAGSASSRAAAPDTLLYLADGTNYAVTNYWLAGGLLHYVTSYGAEDAVPVGQIDLQRTVDANTARGVQFTLRPAPRGDSGSGR